MAKIKLHLLWAALAVGLAGVALAQQITSRTLTGGEVVVAATGGPGGSSLFVPTSQLRNAQNVLTTAVTAGTLATPTNLNSGTLVFTAAAGATIVVDLPANPWDGQIFEIVNGTAATAFTTGGTVATTDGATITGGAAANALGALAAGASAEWRFVQSTNTWYRMR